VFFFFFFGSGKFGLTKFHYLAQAKSVINRNLAYTRCCTFNLSTRFNRI